MVTTRRQRSRAEGTFLEVVATRLANLEKLIVDVHWHATGGAAFGTASGGWAFDVSSRHPNCPSFSAEAPEFIPAAAGVDQKNKNEERKQMARAAKRQRRRLQQRQLREMPVRSRSTQNWNGLLALHLHT